MSPAAVLSREARMTLWRSLQTFTVTRIVIALVLLLYLGVRITDGGVRLDAANTPACLFYLAAALVFGAFGAWWRRRFALQLGCQIAVDLAVISLLYLEAGGMRSGLGILYLFPLAGAAILAPLTLALFASAVATLFLLLETTWQVFMQDDGRSPMQAGLYGAAFFAGVLVVNRLAARLIKQEELAAQRGVDLRVQQAINAIVIADVGDGILVVGDDSAVFTGNPAARRMLGLEGEVAAFRLGEAAGLEPLAQAFGAWLRAPGEDAAFVTVKPYQEDAGPLRGRRDEPVHLKLRFARVGTLDVALGRSVVFMQDVSAIENQAQQLKLASMGRLTASIAHEVRNPLSAIGHATALLAEDLHGPAEVRLLKIVGDNVARVNRMVEDILQLSRKVQPNGEPVQLASFLAELKAEFCETHGLADDIVYLGDPGTSALRFDPLHLHEVLLNLLGNAVRYASREPASIRIFPALDAAGRIELHVQDDGPGITPEVRAHLFEPFYTTSSKGTGLGLYLARELCLNNDAKLDYEYRFDPTATGPRRASGRFVISFSQPA
ncbi:two-component system sensor histidine kinase NtrB [Massilia alkalitolerans]|jgi:two-component system, NtrC family, sensor histidine kinase PilS|uniref:two-component system sensor histidine kinase NtrB n=1 Tax=Massilia alkalitolerans TaxID=286638 RepID=UPI0004221634|nr:ATP-binding protein [Massilia alkalitolerans]